MRMASQGLVVWTALAALPLVACGEGWSTGSTGGETATSDSSANSAGGGGSENGGGGAGGEGGSAEIKEVEVFPKCEGIEHDALMLGTFEYTYDPSEITLNVGEVLKFDPIRQGENMASGTYPDKDGKFYTMQGYDVCLKFNAAGTYPFFAVGSPYPMIGTVFVK
jgi:plastocyanin